MLMKAFMLSTLAVLLFAQPVSADTLFSVKRHVDTPFTGNDFDAAMTDVNARLRTDNDRCSDHPCAVRFWRAAGGIGIFGSTGDGLNTVETQGELETVFAQGPERVKVITFVSRCAGTNNPSFIGCGRCGEATFLVESTVTGEVYVHEYGHNLNLYACGHREDCEWNIMDDNTDGTNDAVTAGECIMFGGMPFTPLSGTIYNGNGGPLTSAGGPYWVTDDVYVPSGQMLTIQSNVEIQFKSGEKFTAAGDLTADGGSSGIYFYSNSNGLPGLTLYGGELLLVNGGQLVLH